MEDERGGSHNLGVCLPPAPVRLEAASCGEVHAAPFPGSSVLHPQKPCKQTMLVTPNKNCAVPQAFTITGQSGIWGLFSSTTMDDIGVLPAPDGVTANFHEPLNSLQITTIVVFGVTFFLATVFMCLRLYASISIVRSFEWDDREFLSTPAASPLRMQSPHVFSCEWVTRPQKYVLTWFSSHNTLVVGCGVGLLRPGGTRYVQVCLSVCNHPMLTVPRQQFRKDGGSTCGMFPYCSSLDIVR